MRSAREMSHAARGHRLSVLWIAAVVHRLSGLALVLFLPIHFFALGLAIEGEARLESFLRWTDHPLVKLAEAGLVFLLLIHVLGGMRLLLVETFAWRGNQRQFAIAAALLATVLALVFLVRIL